MRFVLRFKTIIFLSLLISFTYTFACEHTFQTKKISNKNVNIKIDNCHKRPDEIQVFFEGNALSDESLRDNILKILGSSELSDFKGGLIANNLSNFPMSKWKLGKYYKIFCFDLMPSQFSCSHYTLMRYRSTVERGEFKLVHNQSTVPIN